MGRRRDFLLLLLLVLLFRVEKRKKEKEKGRTAWNDTPTGLFSSRLLFSPDPRESRRRKKLCSIKASARAYLDTRRTRDAVPWILRLFEGGGKRRCSSLVEERKEENVCLLATFFPFFIREEEIIHYSLPSLFEITIFEIQQYLKTWSLNKEWKIFLFNIKIFSTFIPSFLRVITICC